MGEIIRKTKGGKFVGWYLRYVDADGRRKQRASKQPTHAEAKRMLIELEARIARGMVGIAERSQSTTLTLEELFERYREECRNPQVKDLASYRRFARVCLARAEKAAPKIALLPIAGLDSHHIAKLRDALAVRYPAGTVRTTLIHVSAALSWAVAEKLITTNPVRGVTRPQTPTPRRDFLTKDEVQRLLEEAERRVATLSWRGLVWSMRSVAISLAARTGMRKGEIFGLRWSDIDFEAKLLTIARSYASTPKSGKTRHLRLPSALVPLLRSWRERCPSPDLVCPVPYAGSWNMCLSPSVDHGLLELLRAAGCRVLPRPWHLLRHTFASHFMQSGGSLLALSQILGHSDVKTTMVYAHLSSDFLAEQIDKVQF